MGLMVVNTGCDRSEDDIVREVVQMVRDRIGPVAAFKQALIVPRLPKTRSGKILRGTVRRIADGEEWTLPATIEDPVVLEESADALLRAGYPSSSATLE